MAQGIPEGNKTKMPVRFNNDDFAAIDAYAKEKGDPFSATAAALAVEGLKARRATEGPHS